MITESDEATRKWWPHDFRLLFAVIFGEQLTLELTVTNTGTTPFTFEEALHAYFRVGDAESAILQGLDGTDYIDKTDHGTRKTHHGDLTFSAETDRVFLDTQHVIEVQDPVMGRRIILQKQNSLTTVVWNPWAEKSRSMSDLGDEEWRNFVGVEASNVGQYAVHLAPGQGHVMQVDVHVASL
jgi:D-hexose-6-phosphate mutarotase